MKRSGQVALLLMGAGLAGGYATGLFGNNCSARDQQAAAAPDARQNSCSGHGGHGGHFSGGSSETARGGFGSFGHMFFGGG
jgi:hypothetical protein